jgi:hypothetical protein
MVIPFPPFPVLQRPGSYSVEVLADGRHLTQYSLVEALEVAAAASVRLSLDEPWAVDDQTGLTGTTGEIELVKS